jgi:hypothetical protein
MGMAVCLYLCLYLTFERWRQRCVTQPWAALALAQAFESRRRFEKAERALVLYIEACTLYFRIRESFSWV